MKVEEETGVMWPQAKESRRMPAAPVWGDAMNGFSPRTFGGDVVMLILDFRLLAFRTV